MSSLRPVAGLLFAAAGIAGCGTNEAERPNVLLISLDSTRRDMLSCYGRTSKHAPGVPTTPHLDALAAEGVRFEQAYATSSWTLPSHMALMTGQPGVVHAVEMDDLALAGGRTTLAGVLAGAGYRTAGFYSGPYLAPRYGFARGFETWTSCCGAELASAMAREEDVARRMAGLSSGDSGWDEVVRERVAAGTEVGRLSHLDVSSEVVTDAVLAELAAARRDDRPWFVFAHYFDPHYDYVPPAEHDRFDPGYTGAVTGTDFMKNPLISVQEPRPRDPLNRRRVASERDMERILALYDGEMEWTDRQVGRLIDDVRAAGELDDTLVIVLADHGDEFFEHGNLGHRKTLFEEVIRVPMIARYPRKLPRGEAVQGVVSLADVFATVLEVAEVAVPPGVWSRSVLPLTGDAPDTMKRAVLSRLVLTREVESRDGEDAQHVSVKEAFIHWPIKILRERWWFDPGPDFDPARVAEVRAQADQDHARDRRLVWIDLEAHPGEEREAYSDDFGDARAQAALQLYRRQYDTLLGQRLAPDVAASEEGTSALVGLGYIGSDAVPMRDTLVERFTISGPRLP